MQRQPSHKGINQDPEPITPENIRRKLREIYESAPESLRYWRPQALENQSAGAQVEKKYFTRFSGLTIRDRAAILINSALSWNPIGLAWELVSWIKRKVREI